jgi:hypothetical protein
MIAKVKTGLTGESVRIRRFRDDRGHSTAWPLLRNEIPPGATMIALRDLVRAQETRLWKETGGAAGTCSYPGEGRETDERLHELWIQPRGRSADLHQVPQDLFDLLRIGDHSNHFHG